MYLKYSKGRSSPGSKSNVFAKTLVISLATLSAFHAVFMETFPINPFSANSVRFAPRGIDISFVVSTGNKHTTSLVYTLDVFGVQDEDRFLFPPVVEGLTPLPPNMEGRSCV